VIDMQTEPFSPASDLATRLRARGQRATSQRLVVHDALRELGRHVSADQVLATVKTRLPGMSLPTVYATLELFEELGIVRRVSVAGGPVLWDPRTDAHHHFTCRRCGRVEDLEGAVDSTAAVAAARQAGFEPQHVELVVSGLCSRCAA
jgi:Fe2+ or Zn2+ uptake regulation protein